MFTLSLAHDGQKIISIPIQPGEYRPKTWFQGKKIPSAVLIEAEEGAVEREKSLRPGIGKNKKTPVYSCALNFDGYTVIVNVTEGWDPDRPSWNYTVKIKERAKDPAGCSKCGAIISDVADNVEKPLCVKCAEGVSP